MIKYYSWQKYQEEVNSKNIKKKKMMSDMSDTLAMFQILE